VSDANLVRTAAFVRIASRPIPRVSRMMMVGSELRLHCTFVGAFRESNLPSRDHWDSHEVRRVGGFFPFLNGRRVLFYAYSVLRFWLGVVRELRLIKPSVVHASDFEAAMPSVLYCRLAGVPLIYNIHDNLAFRHSLPFGLSRLLNILEGLLVRVSTVALVPEEFRRQLLPRWCRSRIQVVRNTPVDPGCAPPPPSIARCRVMFAGWLDSGRGLHELLAVAAADGIDLTIAGEGDSSIADKAGNTPNTRFLGFLSHENVIHETAACHVVAAFYDPSRPINRFAASNKVAEALALGRPVLINSEMYISPELQAADCAVIIPYADIRTIGSVLANLLRDRSRYLAMCSNARRHYETAYNWTSVKEASRQAFAAAGVR
jgi:glycosyltransferase involved in cell wall biosynthesis